MMKVVVMLIGVFFSYQLQAFPCFLTVVKDSCWTKYTVNITAVNPTTGKEIASINIPQGQTWFRQPFDCEPKETISITSNFTPAIWQQNAGKVYSALHNWSLPEKVATGETAWNITICYPADFAGVPLPPDAGSHCACDTSNIPPVKPQ